MDFFNTTGVFITFSIAFFMVLVAFLFGYIVGASVTEHINEKRQEREKAREEGSLIGMTGAEAYLNGFEDGNLSKKSREREFSLVNFGMRYMEGFNAGTEKRQAEVERYL